MNEEREGESEREGEGEGEGEGERDSLGAGDFLQRCINTFFIGNLIVVVSVFLAREGSGEERERE